MRRSVIQKWSELTAVPAPADDTHVYERLQTVLLMATSCCTALNIPQDKTEVCVFVQTVPVLIPVHAPDHSYSDAHGCQDHRPQRQTLTLD